MKIAIIVQARMTSSRLPGKVLKSVLGKPLLEYQIERLRRVAGASDIVVATTTNASDDPIVELCQRLGVKSFRGPEEDVLARYHGAADAVGAEAIVRVTSDCPLIDPQVIDGVIQAYCQGQPAPDYAANCLERSYPRGMDAEIFSRQALDEAFASACDPAEREHVTPYLYRRPERFRLLSLRAPRDDSRHRWTVDTPEDFELIRRMLEALYPARPEFTLADCLDLLAAHPGWAQINTHIEQKKLGE